MIDSEAIEELTELFAELNTNEPQTQMEELLRAIVATQKAQQETNAALVKQQERANDLKEKELQKYKPKAGDFIPKLGVTDDVEAYLHAFEATAARERWPKTEWVGLLAPFLSGERKGA